MSDIQECKTSRLSWAAASDLIGTRVSEISGHAIDCSAGPDSYDYWSTGLLGYRMPLSELHHLLETMHLDDSEISESLPDCDEKVDSVDCFGMALSRALLRSKIGSSWENESWDDHYLWLIGSPETTAQPHIYVGNCTVSMESLKSKKELIQWLTEHGANYLQLMEFCSDNILKYHNQLCWLYPISDGKHLGTYIVLVKEGVLSLPYDDADRVDGEIFCLEDIRMFTAEDMEEFIESWQPFSQDLQRSMTELLTMLKEREATIYAKS